jgi:hypothetical protein
MAALESDTAVRWLVAVVCVCIVLQTALLTVLAISAVLSGTDATKATIFTTLIDGLKSLRWPLVLFGAVVMLRAPLVAIVETIVSSIVARRLAEESEVSSAWDIGTSIEGLTSSLSSAYDQYEKPMTEQQRTELKAFVANAFANGETEYLRDRKILWLHKEEGHDVGEAQSFRQCEAHVDFCLDYEAAKAKLQQSPDGTYDIVISHMGPSGDAFRLFKWMRENQRRSAFIVYTRKIDDPAFCRDAKELGIHRYTNRPIELFRFALDAVQTMPVATRPQNIPSLLTVGKVDITSAVTTAAAPLDGANGVVPNP